MTVAGTNICRLRRGVQTNRVFFPSQVPLFARRTGADIQWRMVELYFVHSWSCRELGRRYRLTHGRVRQLISEWVRDAADLGYLQEIPAADGVPAYPAAAGALGFKEFDEGGYRAAPLEHASFASGAGL
jgi:hypothetical protein